MMDEFEYGCLTDFIGENWAKFLAFMEERGIDEAQCDDLSNKLDGLAGRN